MTQQRLIAQATATTWSVQPQSTVVNQTIGWLACFALLAGLGLPALTWALFANGPFRGAALVAAAAECLFAGILSYAAIRLWRERGVPLVADRKANSLSAGSDFRYSLTEICDIQINEVHSGGDDRSYSVILRLVDQRTVELPAWFRGLSLDEAQLLKSALMRMTQTLSENFAGTAT